MASANVGTKSTLWFWACMVWPPVRNQLYAYCKTSFFLSSQRLVCCLRSLACSSTFLNISHRYGTVAVWHSKIWVLMPNKEKKKCLLLRLVPSWCLFQQHTIAASMNINLQSYKAWGNSFFFFTFSGLTPHYAQRNRCKSALANADAWHYGFNGAHVNHSWVQVVCVALCT